MYIQSESVCSGLTEALQDSIIQVLNVVLPSIQKKGGTHGK